MCIVLDMCPCDYVFTRSYASLITQFVSKNLTFLSNVQIHIYLPLSKFINILVLKMDRKKRRNKLLISLISFNLFQFNGTE